MECQCLPVRPRIGDQQDDRVEPGVALLQVNLARDRLHIGDPGLGLDAYRSSLQPREAVKRSEVTRDRERHLGLPRRRVWEPPLEPGQQSKLGSVPDRIGRRVRASRQREPNRGARQREVPHGDVLDLVPLYPGERCVIQANGGRTIPQAQTTASPRGADVSAGGSRDAMARFQGVVSRTFAAGHARMIDRVAYPWLTSGVAQARRAGTARRHCAWVNVFSGPFGAPRAGTARRHRSQARRGRDGAYP